MTEKENTELKEKYVKKICDCDICDTYCNSQLTEAKNLIRNLLRVTYGEGWNYSLDVKVKAEQFLAEQFLKEATDITDIREASTLDGDWVVDEH